MLPDMTANRGIMKSKQREYYMQNRQKIADADKHMWNIMKGVHFASQICRPRVLGLGCGIFFFELFCGVAIFTVALFESAGYGGMDMGAAGENLLDPAWRKEVDDHIASRDPFCVFIGSPGRGPLSSLTADAKDLDKAAGWIAKLTSNLVAKGRIVILDEAFEELQTSDDDGPVTRLEGSLMDGFTGEPFEFMTGAYTYGSNSSEIKGVLDILDVNITGPSVRYASTPSIAEEILRKLVRACEDELDTRTAFTAFPAEMVQEELEERGPLDSPDDDGELPVPGDRLGNKAEEEQEFLDGLKLDGFPQNEQERRELWMKLPRETRAAIRRLHHMIGHKPNSVLLHIMKGARLDKSLIGAVRFFKCDDCNEISKPQKESPVAEPKAYTFNHENILDVLENKDNAGERYSWLNILCAGTVFQQVALVRVGGGQPSSAKCLAKYQTYWQSWAGWPNLATTDRGLHNRGAFSRALKNNSVYQRQAGVEAPEQIGRGERHGGIWKTNMKHVVKAHHIVGKQHMKIAGSIVTNNKNEMCKVGGIAASQWVLGRYPRGVGWMLEEEELGQLGTLHHSMDSTTAFGLRASYRLTSMSQFVRQDCGRRYAAAQLRKSVPLPGPYRQGDLICYKTDQGAQEPGTEWNGPARILGLENRTVWCMHNCVPVAASIKKIRPAPAAEVLAYQVLSRNMTPFTDMRADVSRSDDQQAFIDVRGSDQLDRAVAPPAEQIERAVAPHFETEAEATGSRRRLKRTRFSEIGMRDDEELDPPIRPAGRTASNQTGGELESDADDETLTPLEQAWERHAPGRSDRGRELLREMAAGRSQSNNRRSRSPARDQTSATFGGIAPEAQRSDAAIAESSIDDAALVAVHYGANKSARGFYEELQGFLAERLETEASKAWLANKRKSLEKRGKIIIYEKADDDVKRGLNQSRRAEWDKWKKYSAAVVIPASAAAELVSQGVEEIPTQWIDNDKNEHLRKPGGPKVDTKFKSRLVGRGDLEIAELRSDSPTAENESVCIVLSFASSRKLRIKKGDISNAYFQGEKLIRKLLLRQPKGGLQDDSVRPDDRLLAQVPIYGTRDAGRGFWKRLRQVLLDQGLQENFIFVACYTYTNAEHRVLLILVTHVDDLIYANEDEVQHMVDQVKKELDFGEDEEWEFRYCGREIVQNRTTYEIRMTCKATSDKLEPIRLQAGRMKAMASPLTADEQNCFAQ